MADRQSYAHQVQVHPQHTNQPAGVKSLLPKISPSTSQVLAVVTLLPVGGTLLFLAGITLIGTLIGLAVATPLFIIFSPVLVPAALAIGLAVTGFLGSGAFGLTGLSSLSWVLSYFRQASAAVPDQIELAKKRAQEMAGYAGQKTKDLGHAVQSKAAGQAHETATGRGQAHETATGREAATAKETTRT